MFTTNAVQAQSIVFPPSLLGDLIVVASRATCSPPDRWGFVASSYNVPYRLLCKLNNNGSALTDQETEELEKYFFDYDLIARVTEGAIDGARRLSGFSEATIKLALGKSKPIDRAERRLQRRAVEGLALHAELVGGKFGSWRCSRGARADREDQLQRQNKYLKTLKVRCVSTGQLFELGSAEEKKQKRKAELYAIAKGIEKEIASTGMAWLSAVASAKGEAHPNPTNGRRHWNGQLPHQTAAWFSACWALVRARLTKLDIPFAGLWTREAHKDACPHVNFLIAFPEEHYKEVARAFTEVFAHSPKAIKIRRGGRVQPGEKAASFASYAMKYFLKGMQGWGTDLEADCEEATAAAFGYRRYDFFGVPARNTWREMRRSNVCPPNSDPTIAALWRAARRGDAATFIALSGGLACRRNERPIQTLRETPVGCSASQVVGVRRVVEINGTRQDVCHVRTRTPGQYKLISTGRVTLILNYPREAVSGPHNPSTAPPQSPPTLH